MTEALVAVPVSRHNALVNAPLNVEKGSGEWKLFKCGQTTVLFVARLSDDEEDCRRALFLHTLGQEGLTVDNGIQLEENHTLDDIINAFDNHFIGKTYERYVFNKRDQKIDESVEDYIATLHTLASTCNFCDCLKDSLQRDRIVLGIKDSSTRKRFLQEGDLSLKTCADMCRAAEATAQQLKSLKIADDTTAEACSVSARDRKPHKWKAMCKFRSQTHVLQKALCPACGKVCSARKKRNHFAVKCTKKRQKKNLHLVENDSLRWKQATGKGHQSR